MVRNHFHLVSKILADGFYSNISRAEIERDVYTNGEFDEQFEVVVDDGGTDVPVVLRLIVHRGRKTSLETFAIAVLIHDVRIAGIDFEARSKDPGGKKAHGWHRHEWDASARTSDYRKIPLEAFDGFTDLDGFLVRAMQVLKITFSGRDYGAPGLQFN
jgi:hypothetical protein